MKIFDILPVGEENAISAKLSVQNSAYLCANAALEYQKNCKRARSVFLQHIVPADISDHLPAKKGVKNFCAFTVENFRAAVRVLEN